MNSRATNDESACVRSAALALFAMLIAIAADGATAQAQCLSSTLETRIAVGRNGHDCTFCGPANERLFVYEDQEESFAIQVNPDTGNAVGRLGDGWGDQRGVSDLGWGDVDGDAVPELIVARDVLQLPPGSTGEGPRVIVYRDTGAGYVSIKSFGDNWGGSRWASAIAVADLDNDGRAEIVVGRNAGDNARVTVFDDETTGFAVIKSWGEGWGSSRGVESLAVGDIDGDGQLEIVVGRNDGDNERVFVHDDISTGFALIQSFGRGWGSDRSASALAIGQADVDAPAELLVGRDAGPNQRMKIWNWAGTQLSEIATNFFTGWGDGRGVTAIAFSGNRVTRADASGVVASDSFEIAVGRNAGSGPRVGIHGAPATAPDIVGPLVSIASLGNGWGDSHGTTALAWADLNGPGLADLAIGRTGPSNGGPRVILVNEAFVSLATLGNGWGSDRSTTAIAIRESTGQLGGADRDGDGLPDDWEINGANIDCAMTTQCGGCPAGVDVDLPAMNADPDHKDLYVELDWLPGFPNDQPRRAAIQALKAAFLTAPLNAGGITNPDNTPGINLWVDTGGLMDPTTGLLVGDNFGGGGAIAVPAALPNLPIVGIPNLTTDTCPTGETCNATGVDTGTCSTSGQACSPENGFQVVKDANFDPNRTLIFRYGISAPPASSLSPAEDGQAPGTCADGIDNRGNGADGTDAACQPLSEDGAGAGSCYDNVDNRGNGADGADPACALLQENGAGPGTCFDFIDNVPTGTPPDGADGADPGCQLGNEDGAGPGTCFDTIDNAGDGVDGADPECAVGAEDGAGAGTCFDGLDNSGDGVDDNDTECAGQTEDGAGPGSCTDNIDNRANGTDGADAACAGGSEDGGPAGSCFDGVDNAANGGDAADPVCAAGTEDGAPAGSCFDGIDNAANGADGADPACQAGGENGAGPGTCFDGVDNSAVPPFFPGDGLSDGADPDCVALVEDTGGAGSCYDTIDNASDGADVADPACAALVEDAGGPGSCYDTVDNVANGADGTDPVCAALIEDGAVPGSCFDTVDNIADGADGGDPECRNLREDGAAFGSCSDGLDNMFDGIDGADSDCSYGGGWGESLTNGTGLGSEYIGGNDFIEYNHDPGTLMHEIGHTLGLNHGGAEVRNCKPNYTSVMNYAYQSGIPQLPGSWTTGGGGWGSCAGAADPACLLVDTGIDGIGDNVILDYSPARLPDGSREVLAPPLDETTLLENAAGGVVLNPVRQALREDGAPVGSCSDGIDNRANGADAADPACAMLQENGAGPGTCFDMVDNVAPGMLLDGADGADPGCQLGNEDGAGPGTCFDTIDNAADLADGLDPDCGAHMVSYAPFIPGNSENTGTCADGVDNDLVNGADIADPACFNPTGSEGGGPALSCSDGLDNDGLNGTDAADPTCFNPAQSEATGTCTDGFDNDGNGLTDQLDRACVGFRVVVPLSGADISTPSNGVPDGLDWAQNGLISAVAVRANLDTQDKTGWPAQCANNVLGGVDLDNNNVPDDFDGDMNPDVTPARSHDDWSNIRFSFVDSPALPRGAALNLGPPHPTTEELEQALYTSRATDLAIDAPTGSHQLNVMPGGQIHLLLVVRNQGFAPAYGPVIVTVELPAGATAISLPSYCTQPSASTLQCNLGSIGAGLASPLVLDLQLLACLPGTAVVATVDNPAGADWIPGNDGVSISVADTTAPEITAPPEVVTRQLVPDLGVATATDDCDPSPDIFNDAPSVFPLGTTVVDWWAVDDAGNESVHVTQLVTILGGDGSWVGQDYSCGLTREGEVYCWGNNVYGQLGDGTTTERWAPAFVDLADTTAQLSVGSKHACAVLSDETVACWGSGDDGRLGNGSTANRSTPVAVAGLAGVRQVSAGGQALVDDAHTCAVVNSGAVYCWGEGVDGQLGNGSNFDRDQPVQVQLPPGVVITQVTTGGEHTCAVSDSGAAYCWGEGLEGQLGNGNESNHNTPVLVALPPGVTVSQIEAGDDHTCAVVDTGDVYCWGKGEDGRLGNGSSFDRDVPVLVQDLPLAAAQVSCGSAHTCAALDDGSVFCWGDGGSGRLGNGSLFDRLLPVQAIGVSSAVQVSAGTAHTCARTFDGQEYKDVCWGENDAGQLGDGSSIDRSTAVAPALLCEAGSAPAVSAGGTSTCAKAMGDGPDAHVFCWGSNSSGQLGDGTIVSRRAALPTSANDSVLYTAVGTGHACEIRSDGRLLCWGSNGSGRLGDGTTTNRLNPTLANDTALYLVVAAGQSHSCGITTTPTQVVKCWGSGLDGRLGNGTTTNRLSPTAVVGLPGVPLSLDVGDAHSCAVVQNGANREVWCWGEGSDGRLGNGSTSDRLQPVKVSGISNALLVSAGAQHSCASRQDASVWCWGEGSDGRLGNGSILDRTTPVRVVDGAGTPIAAPSGFVSAGGAHSCVSNVAGQQRVACWGRNLSGELGDGSTVSRSRAAVIGSMLGVSSVTAGGQHSCAELHSGDVLCWGSNTSGQVGDGTLQSRSSPTLLSAACN
jgi:alpha-tubulin suppressor-like RCC1 family protein